METIYIVNVNEHSFFRYNKKNENDNGYNKFLKQLLTPPDKTNNYSHWNRNDKIVFGSEHLKKYLEKTYNELYLQS